MTLPISGEGSGLAARPSRAISEYCSPPAADYGPRLASDTKRCSIGCRPSNYILPVKRQRAYRALYMNVAPNSKHHSNIVEIQDLHTRSLLRGLLNCEDRDVLATFNHLRTTTSSKDAEAVSWLVLCSPLFSHLKTLLDDFPSVPPLPHRRARPTDQTLHNEIVFQGVRIQKHSDKLTQALNDLRAVNEFLLSADAPGSLGALELH